MAKIKFGAYRGLYFVGDKATGRITDVQTVTPDGDSIPVPHPAIRDGDQFPGARFGFRGLLG